MPDWYGLVAAAHYLHVPPWELMEQPAIWTNWALTAHSAEQQAHAEMMAEQFKGK